MNYSISVYVGDIPELRQFSLEKDHLRIGANITLTDLESVAEQAIDHYGPARGQPFAAVLKQLRYFAGRQIRNVGTPAGNLATASPISDLNPVFMATNSVLTASTTNGESLLLMSKFFTGYRQTALPSDGILSSIKIPIAKPKNEFIRAYKQAKRKDDDIAIVNAALRVSLDDNRIIESVNLVYGGMAAVTKSATKTEEYLVGKEWGTSETLEGAMNALEDDFNLPFSVPGGMAQYRKSLALGFFYRFWNEVQAELSAEVDADVIPEIEREVSSGSRDVKASVAYEQRVLGKDVPHVAAMKQVAGEAIYTDDIPHQQGQLYGKLVLSAKAHAKLLNVDASAALEMPGVKAFVTHKDFHDPQANYWGAPVSDEVFLAVDEVFTHGQPIGIILADSAAQAEAAVRAVRVEYEELPAILTMEEAIEKNSFFSHDHSIINGEPVEEAFKKADRVIEGVSRMGGQEHFYLETNAVVIVPKGEDGEVEVYSCTQNPTET
jgi:xanthine dehydrogenase/oxidase